MSEKRGRKTGWRLLAVGLALLVGASAVVAVQFRRESYLGEICWKCLRHRRTKTWSLHGVQLCEWSELGTGSSNVHPELYQEILGEACRHRFVPNSHGSSYRGMYGSGHPRWLSVGFLRYNAICSLYQAYVRTSDRETARAVYEFIDQTLPFTQPDGTWEAAAIPLNDCDWDGGVRRGEEDWGILLGIRKLEHENPEAARLARCSLTLGYLADRLDGEETTEEFRAVLE